MVEKVREKEFLTFVTGIWPALRLAREGDEKVMLGLAIATADSVGQSWNERSTWLCHAPCANMPRHCFVSQATWPLSCCMALQAYNLSRQCQWFRSAR